MTSTRTIKIWILVVTAVFGVSSCYLCLKLLVIVLLIHLLPFSPSSIPSQPPYLHFPSPPCSFFLPPSLPSLSSPSLSLSTLHFWTSFMWLMAGFLKRPLGYFLLRVMLSSKLPVTFQYQYKIC